MRSITVNAFRTLREPFFFGSATFFPRFFFFVYFRFQFVFFFKKHHNVTRDPLPLHVIPPTLRIRQIITS